MCIVHGPFGCGKSTLLVALLQYLLHQRSQDKGPLKGCRILVTAHTNIAVDRVILGLVDSGCTGLWLNVPNLWITAAMKHDHILETYM